MSRRWLRAAGASFGAALLLAPVRAEAGPAEERIEFGRFGSVAIQRESEHPSRVVLFVSGDGGWKRGVVEMASALAARDALVVGVDVREYLRGLAHSKDRCSYPAADFEALSQFVQKRLGFPHYVAPVLAGYSSGATLVYATLAQAPPNTFRGAISLGFCPDLPLAPAPCRGRGLEWSEVGRTLRLAPAKRVPAPWIVIQGAIDRVCNAAATAAFVKQVAGAELVELPHVGHGFAVRERWLPPLTDALARLTAPGPEATRVPPAGLTDLPLVEMPAVGEDSDVLAVVVSGDGGWAGLDRDVAGALARRGVPVVGLDSLRYFWSRKTPDQAAHDLERILRGTFEAWDRRRAILVGYSRGADVLPFMVSRLPADLRARVAEVALLGPSPRVDFEFHVSEWLQAPSAEDRNELSVAPEIERLRGLRVLCVYGSDESDSVCPTLPAGLATLDRRPGGHHFGGDYEGIAARILAEAGLDAAQRGGGSPP